MYTWDYNLFIGDDTVDIHVGFATAENTFIIGEFHSPDEGDVLKDVLDSLKTDLSIHKPASLINLVSLIETELKLLREGLVSFALVHNIDSTMYVVTRGKGEVYIERGGIMQKLLSGDATASGKIEEGDYFLLANSTFITSLEQPFLQDLLSHTKPQEVIETITPQLKGTNNVGMIALFMQANQREETADTEVVIDDDEDDENEYVGGSHDEDTTYGASTAPDPVYSPQATPTAQISTPTVAYQSRLATLKAFFGQLQTGSSKGRKITFGIVVLLLVVLAWSVVSGNSRRQKAKFVENVATQTIVIEGKLDEAEKLAGLNTQKSLQLIDESRQILSDLQQEARSKKLESVPELKDLAGLITSTEQGIKKTEKGRYAEFYDLALIEKGTHATAMYQDGSLLALLDADNGKVYMLDVVEKSVDTYSASQVRKASFVSIHQREPYIFGPTIGVYKFTETQKAENVIPPDKDWGIIKDFAMYSGNIYLLDSGKSDIHKYLVAEEGYSSKRSYFGAGEATGLASADALTIDSSVYVAAGAKVLKYASGVREGFSFAIPDETAITFEDVFAGPDSDNVYALDKDSQRIFVADKAGQFQKQISADILKNADDFVVDPNEGILILANDTIYSIKE